MYAFRCNTCGALATSENAGERSLPASCHVCGAGVVFSPSGVKTFLDSNWTVLAELDGEAREAVVDYHKLEDHEIVIHTPLAPGASGDRVISVDVEDGLGSEDKANL